MLTNVGRLPLTNLIIDLGGDTQKLPVLQPGETILISPKSDAKLDMVKVSSDEGITITKEFRIPPKVPGMPHSAG